MQISLFINGEKKTYSTSFLSGELYKDFFDIQRKLQMVLQGDASPKIMDIMVDFVCRTYGNQFTIDQYWKGVPLNKVLSEIVRTINEIGEMIMEDVEGVSEDTH